MKEVELAVLKRRARLSLAVGLLIVGALVGSAAAIGSTTIHGTLSTGDYAYPFLGTAGPSSCTKGSSYGFSFYAPGVSNWYMFNNASTKEQCVDVKLTPNGFCGVINSFSAQAGPGFGTLGESGATSGFQHYSYWVGARQPFYVTVVGNGSGFPPCSYTLTVQIGRAGPATGQLVAAPGSAAPARP
jgi:hypothetical protein